MVETILDNVDVEFAYNSEVTIISGMYKGRNGLFKRVEINTPKGTKFYIIESNIDNRVQLIRCNQSDIIKKKKWYSFK